MSGSAERTSDPFEPKVIECGKVGPVSWSVTGGEAWPDRFIVLAMVHVSKEDMVNGSLEEVAAKARSMAAELHEKLKEG